MGSTARNSGRFVTAGVTMCDKRMRTAWGGLYRPRSWILDSSTGAPALGPSPTAFTVWDPDAATADAICSTALRTDETIETAIEMKNVRKSKRNTN